jgi:hypothetical protein
MVSWVNDWVYNLSIDEIIHKSSGMIAVVGFVADSIGTLIDCSEYLLD